MQPASQDLAVVAPIARGRLQSLRTLLRALNLAVLRRAEAVPPPGFSRRQMLRCDDLPHTHFFRFVIVEDRDRDGALLADGVGHPPVLVWSANHDGTSAAYLDALCADRARIAGLDAIFGHCEGYRGGSARAVRQFCLRRLVRSEAFYAGYRGEPRRRVLNDRAVRREIRAFVDTHAETLNRLTPEAARRRIFEHLRDHRPDLDVSRTPDPARGFARGWRRLRAGFWLGLPVWLWVAVPAAVATWVHDTWFDRDQPWPATRPVHHEGHLESEDFFLQNQLTHVADVKPGWFRLWLLRLVFLVIEAQARTRYTEGHLGNVRSIHFARWILLLDRRRGVPREHRRHRLLFFSNYDMSWDSYLGEFIDRAAGGLSGVWSNTCGFPRTRMLLFGGAADEEAFKQWARRCQRESDLWWSGYRDSTVRNVRSDLFVRRYLTGPPPPGGLDEWFRLL